MKIFIPQWPDGVKYDDENLDNNIDNRKRPIKEALEILTDEYIENGDYCDQTIIDLRDCLKTLLRIK